MNRNRRKQKLPLEKVSNSQKKQKSPSVKINNSQKKKKLPQEKVNNSRKRQKLSVEKNNSEKEDLDERMKTFEQKLADKGAQLNLNNVPKKEEIRKLKPELKKIGAQLKHEKEQFLREKEQLLKEKERIDELLKEKQTLLIKTANFEKRLVIAEEKLDDFSKEVMKSKNAVANINSLPDEMLFKIFGYIRQNKYGPIARVCKRWNALTKCPVLRKIVDVEFDEPRSEIKSFMQTLQSYLSSTKIDLYDDDYYET